MHKYDLTCSIVTYQTDEKLLADVIRSVESNNHSLKIKIYLIDNSPSDQLSNFAVTHSDVEYIFNDKNLGFGKAHNVVLKKVSDLSKYHLILNPDIFFDKSTLVEIFRFMQSRTEIGLLMPEVRYPDKSIQYLCKRIPSPIDLVVRRFLPQPLKFFFKKRLERYELRDQDLSKCTYVPYLSGCFMFLRSEVVRKVGFFDERYFMYMEDIDFSRRIAEQYMTIFYPKVTVIHHHARESYRLNRLFVTHLVSAIKYFNKWGWLKDSNRCLLNEKVGKYENC